MNDYNYIMPDRGYGAGYSQKSLSIDPILLLALEEFTTVDPRSRKRVTIAVLNHNAWMNPDIQLHVNIRRRYKQLQKDFKDGKGTKYRDIRDFVRFTREARRRPGLVAASPAGHGTDGSRRTLPDPSGDREGAGRDSEEGRAAR
ncbi:hypothetical protein AB0H71_29015 [Nocardia sp. NPDC050697]|uniref:hypothetical protein n=1 Tax=Nocardia sp. NPDC050697 TaxID=3155158 RepID=UPI0033E250DA